MARIMTIDGVNINTFGATLLGTPRVSNAQVKSSLLVGTNRTGFVFLENEIGQKAVEVHIAIQGTSYNDIQIKKSKLRAALLGKTDIYFGDDEMYYWVVYDGNQVLEREDEHCEVIVLNFTAVQHGELITQESSNINCLSTMPYTDARLQVTATAAASKFVLGTVTFKNVVAGDVLVADGINGAVLQNDIPVVAEFVRLPFLSAGNNSIACTNGTPTVEYYPVYL